MRKLVALFVISLLVQAGGLLWVKGKDRSSYFEFLLPEEAFVEGTTVSVGEQEVNLRELKEKGKLTIKCEEGKREIWVEPFKAEVKPEPGRTYSKFHLRVRGESEISINLPLWLLRAVLWLVPHVEVEDHEEEAVAREIIEFLRHPESFLGGYVGPVRFLYVKDEDEEVEIVLH